METTPCRGWTVGMRAWRKLFALKMPIVFGPTMCIPYFLALSMTIRSSRAPSRPVSLKFDVMTMA
jgi:hypothetical protein